MKPKQFRNSKDFKRTSPVGAGLMAALLALGVTQSPVQAGNAALMQLLKVLRDRGSISAAEYDSLKLAADMDEKDAAKPAHPVTQATAAKGNEGGNGAVPPPAVVTPTTTGAAASSAVAKSGTNAMPVVASAKAQPKWSDRLSIRGYVQFRYNAVLDETGPGLNVPGDRSVGPSESFFLRRVRATLSGDVSDHVFLYLQPDFNATPSDGQYSVQLRDVYADVSFDKAKEYRVRLGQSKVPYGFSNMQSSQSRAALERPDAINSAQEGERDIGAFFYWAPSEVRERFRHLVSSGLKGSGDYGVAGFGVYSGQGMNRADRNGDLHIAGRLSYPWEVFKGQIFETGIQAYTGRFVVDTESVTGPGGTAVKPAVRTDGIADERVALSAIWYPQPLGFEAEWNVGRGPQLSDDFTRIESRFLQGGYVQVNYRQEIGKAVLFPFVRWQRYDGGRKFAKNAPGELVDEIDVGIEWSPWKEIEVTVAYTHTYHRTNTKLAPYLDAAGSDRLGMQVQWNY